MLELHEALVRSWNDLVARPQGPLALRFLLQPAVAALLAIRDGRSDARAERSPYLRALLLERGGRWRRLQEGLAAVSRVLLLAFALDAMYQLAVLKWIYPGELILVAFGLAFVPYLLVRGPAGRIARLAFQERSRGSARESLRK